MSSEGLVKGVLSGDLIVVSGKLDKNHPDKAPEEKTLSLSMISNCSCTKKRFIFLHQKVN